MVLILLVLFCIAVLASLGEVYFEWDAGEGITFPRETFRFVVIFGAILLFSLAS